MMRLHKLYHRLTLLSFSSPLSLPSNPSLLPLTPPLRLTLRHRNATNFASMSTSRFRHLAPLSAVPAEDGAAGASNGPVSSSATAAAAATSTDYEDDSNLGAGYRVPPPEIRDIVDAPPVPALSFSPLRDKIIFLKRRALRPLAELARPEEKLAGLRIDGNCNSRSRMSFYTGLGIHQILPDGTLGPEIEVHGFPDGAKINFVTWSPDGRHLSFSIRVNEVEEDNNSSKFRVWIADVETGKARPLFQSPNVHLNAVFDNYVWVDNSSLLVCTIPLSRGAPPKKPLVPSGPKIQSNEDKSIIQVRTFQDLLKDEYDEDLFDYYATSQLVLASLDGTTKDIGPPAVYTSMDPSPDQKYILISSIHRPYSFIVPCGRFPKKEELWSADGKFVRELCDLPLAEDIPIAFNSVRKGMRSINWRSDKPSTLYWVETQDGGDAKVEISPRDIIYTQPAEPLEGEQPVILHKLDLRYGGISWCDDSLALVYESWYKTRQIRTWVVSPGSEDVTPRILFDRSSEDVYSDPGSPMMRRTQAGTYIIAKIKKGSDEGRYIILNGNGATPDGNIPFLDLFDINTGNKERIWESEKEKYYETVVALMSDQEEGDLQLDKLKILTSKESKTENTQYYLVNWPDKKVVQITNFPHPYPQLASLQKEMIRYQRKDGVQLTATLYLPPGYNPSTDGPLPCLVWSYPGEFKSKDAAGQVRGSPNEFAGIGPTSALLWLARRFAILSGPTIPIIGEGDEEANDRYVEQLVASAEAAVEEVIRRGVAHPKKIAVGGHSYGAFMTANLLAHAPHLFCCGVARSGAYNRTLTPFGFQNEDRTLWEATNTYVEMSPFMSANKIKKPILLIHGEEDNNSGTLTMQSDRFFNALKGHGALCRLVILPHESHGYTARESIMHVLWETGRWLHKYCVSNSSDEGEDHDTGAAVKENVSKGATDAESKVVAASGGGSREGCDLAYEEFHSLPRSSLCTRILAVFHGSHAKDGSKDRGFGGRFKHQRRLLEEDREENWRKFTEILNRNSQGSGDRNQNSGDSHTENAESSFTRDKWRKLEIPIFSGEEVYRWVSRVEKYFDLKGVTDQEKIQTAKTAMEGEVVWWSKWWEISALNHTWEDFRSTIIRRFQPSQQSQEERQPLEPRNENKEESSRETETKMVSRVIQEFKKGEEEIETEKEDSDAFRSHEFWNLDQIDMRREEEEHPKIKVTFQRNQPQSWSLDENIGAAQWFTSSKAWSSCFKQWDPGKFIVHLEDKEKV